MTKVGKVDHRIKNCLYDVGYEKWSRTHAPIDRGRMMTSNIVERINGYFVEARKFPIIEFSKKQEYYLGHKTAKMMLERSFEEILLLNRAKKFYFLIERKLFACRYVLKNTYSIFVFINILIF